MGQTASNQRDQQGSFDREPRRLSHLLASRTEGAVSPSRYAIIEHEERQARASNTTSHASDTRASRPFATFSRHISAQSVPVLNGGPPGNRNVSTRDQIYYEQREERPLVHMEDLGMGNAPITHITASPMPRQSRFSRLSSWVLPRYSTEESSANDDPAFGGQRSLRRRLSSRVASSMTSDGRGRQARRSSTFGSFPSATFPALRLRRRRELAPISRPYPLNASPSGFVTSQSGDTQSHQDLPSDPGTRASGFFTTPLGARLSRVRRSISSPLELFSPTNSSDSGEGFNAQISSQTPPRLALSGDLDLLLPSFDTVSPNPDVRRSSSDATRFLNREARTSTISTVSESSERAVVRTDNPNWAERWTERGTAGRREGRRMPSMLRGRTSRLIRRDNEGPLPRILSLAASAIAAQLSGAPDQSLPDIQSIGPEDLDGSLNNLFRTLQNATSVAGDTSTINGANVPGRATGSNTPLNFLRVFRFVSQSTASAASHDSSSFERSDRRSRIDNQFSTRSSTEDSSDDADGRTVTLVVVGVRSVPSEHAGHDGVSASEAGLDTLLNMSPLTPAANVLRSGTAGLLRHANGRSRIPHRRRASVGGFHSFPANYDSQRHQRNMRSTSPTSGDITPNLGATTPLVLSESPPGPHPPPSTPADPGLSRYSSYTTTPSRRPSSASAIQQDSVPIRADSIQPFREHSVPTSERRPHRTVQQRRRSDSEFARHQDLGAGAARRNGVVEPDNIETGDSPASGSRSWLIYVVGTNLSEDHPALTTPSLFTDVSITQSSLDVGSDHWLLQNPTYEDMLLLSSLLGPAKPPVASQEDVASAEGTYRVQLANDNLVAAAIESSVQIQIGRGERCLVCLDEYRIEDELRQLNRCSHLYHRECIDEVR